MLGNDGNDVRGAPNAHIYFLARTPFLAFPRKQEPTADEPPAAEVVEVIETPHEYSNNMDQTWECRIPGGMRVALWTFLP